MCLGILQVALEEHRAVPEGRFGLAAGVGHRLAETDRAAHGAHAAPAAAGRRLDQQRPPQRVQLGVVGQPAVLDGDRAEGGDPRGPHQVLGADLGSHGVDGRRARAHPGEPGSDDHPGEVPRLRQEPVARGGWHRPPSGRRRRGSWPTAGRCRPASPRAAARPCPPPARGGCRRRRRSRRPRWRCPSSGPTG